MARKLSVKGIDGARDDAVSMLNGRLKLDPLALRSVEVALLGPLVALALPVPDHLAAVERPPEDLANRGRRPTAGPSRRRDAVLVQRFRDTSDALDRQAIVTLALTALAMASRTRAA